MMARKRKRKRKTRKMPRKVNIKNKLSPLSTS